MSDNNQTRAATARQIKQAQPSHYELSRAYAKQATHNMAVKAGEVAQQPAPTGRLGVVGQMGQTVSAGGKDLGKAGYHAGMGFIEGVSKQNPNAGQQLNNMKISQAITEGRLQHNKVNRANEIKQSGAYSQKANKTNQSTANKGIEAARQKASANQSGKNSSQSTNKGIANFQSKMSGQSSSASKSSASGGQSKGSSQGR